MRRALAAAAAFSTIFAGAAQAATVAPASATQSGAEAFSEVFQTADAMWTVHSHGNTYMYFGGAWRSVGVTKNRSVAYASRSKCVVTKRKHFKVTVCVGSAPSVKIPDKSFEFDPALRSASVAFAHKGERNKMRWAADPPPFPNASPGVGTSSIFAEADLGAQARASGHVVDHTFKHRGGFSFLNEGALAFAFVDRSKNATIHYRMGQSRVHFRAVFRTPAS